MKKKLILAASLMVLASACQQPKKTDAQMQQDQYDRRGREMQRSGCGSCETEKQQTPQAGQAAQASKVAPAASQQSTVAAPEVKVEKTQ